MNAHFNTEPRFTPAGVTTAAVLVVMVAMAISTLLPSETSQTGDFATSSAAKVAQSHQSTPGKRS